MHPIPPPYLESREDRDQDYFDRYAPKRFLAPLIAFLILGVVVLVSVLIWGG